MIRAARRAASEHASRPERGAEAEHQRRKTLREGGDERERTHHQRDARLPRLHLLAIREAENAEPEAAEDDRGRHESDGIERKTERRVERADAKETRDCA